MRTLTRGLAVPLVIAALALSACAADPEPAASTPPPAALRAPSPTPTPTRPALDELVLTPEGLGDIRIGQPVPDADPALAIVTWNARGCEDTWAAEQNPAVGYWQSVAPRSQSGYGGVDVPFFLWTEGAVAEGAVLAVHVRSDVRTAEGIGIGSTRAEVEAAYPAPTAVIDNRGQSTVYSIEEGGRRLVIEVTAENFGEQSEWNGRVLAMWASSTDVEVFGMARGDIGGPCPG